jgi:hypothetical protein
MIREKYFMRISNLISSIVILAALTGCAHPIVISPNIEKIGQNTVTQPINKNVAYYIAEDVRTKEVITPGGGGDKVSYQPYRDIETAFYKMLSTVFPNVTKLKALNDVDAISKNNVSYIITPVIVTDSSSPSPLTWPPTKFSAELTCNITDAAGNPVLSAKVFGEGAAEFDEFKKDFAMSGKRATENALLKMQRALSTAPELRADGSMPVINRRESKNEQTPVSAVTNNQPTTYSVLAAPAVEQSGIRVVLVSGNPVTTAAPVEVTVMPATPLVISNNGAQNTNTKIQTVEFRQGISSVTVEKIAKKYGCVGGKGAGLITPQGPVEVYRMACDNGRTFMAKCEMRQCSAMR